MTGGTVEVDGVPQDDGRDDQVEAGCPVPLVLEGAVAQFAEPVEEDGAGERVAGFARVEDGVGAATQIGTASCAATDSECSISESVVSQRQCDFTKRAIPSTTPGASGKSSAA